MGWPEPGVRAKSRGVPLPDVVEAQGTQRTSDPGRIVFKAESPWGSSWPSPHGTDVWHEAQGGPGLIQVPGFFPTFQMSLPRGTQPSQSLTKVLRWTKVWDTPEILGQKMEKAPADCHGCAHRRETLWGKGTEEKMRRVHRFSPDEANEGPAGQHQDTGQGHSKEAAWGLRTCVRCESQQSQLHKEYSPFTRLLYIFFRPPLRNRDMIPAQLPPQG